MKTCGGHGIEKLARIAYTNGMGERIEAEISHARELRRRLEAIFPIAECRSLDSEGTWNRPRRNGDPGLPNLLTRLNGDLERRRLNDQLPAPAPLYYGFLVGNLGGGKADDIPGHLASGWMPTDEFVYGRNRHAHELGHVLGRHHAVDSGLGLSPGGLARGYCRELADPLAPDFPFFHVLHGGKKPTLGPMDQGPASMAWGLDTNLERRYAPVVVNPTNTYELMGYCSSPVTDWRWISTHAYTNIYHLLTNRFPPQPTGGGPAFQAAAGADYLLFSGEIDLAGNTAALDPALTIRLAQPPAASPGDYLLRLRNAAGAVLSDVSFAPMAGEPDAPELGEPTIATFAVPVPSDPAIRRVEILRAGQILAARQASANPPTVTVISPNGGESIANDPVLLQWQGNDLDGDALSYVVQYSSDGGQTWETLAMDLQQPSHTVRLRNLKGTAQGRIRVQASDGFHTAMDASDAGFTVANHAPDLAVLSPADNELVAGEQQIVLQADLSGSEDGRLGGSQARWTSSLDGLLGSGPALALNAANLSEGDHLITVTGTDSGGASASRTFRLRVRREVSPLLEMERAGGEVRVSWPAALADFVLEWSDSLAPGAWTPVPHAPEIAGGLKRTILPAVNAQSFFRLRKP